MTDGSGPPLPALDAHAHLATPPNALPPTRAVVLAMTNSLTQYQQALRWQHPLVTWAVGAHPAEPTAIAAASALDDDVLAAQLAAAPLIGEIGLDGTGHVPMHIQRDLLDRILHALRQTPRPASLHSRRAVTEMVQALRNAPPGIILHWWTGGPTATRAVLDAGCYISINVAQARHPDLLRRVPPNRVLTETDHPHGDRAARPGVMAAVEEALAQVWSTSRAEARRQVWRNFDRILADTASHAAQPELVQQLCQLARNA